MDLQETKTQLSELIDLLEEHESKLPKQKLPSPHCKPIKQVYMFTWPETIRNVTNGDLAVIGRGALKMIIQNLKDYKGILDD